MNKKTVSLGFLSTVLVLIIIILYTAIFTVLFAFHGIRETRNSKDMQLLISIKMYHEMIGQDFHNGLLDSNSINFKDYQENTIRNSKLAKNLGLQYLWSNIIIGEDIVFTSSTHTDLTDLSSSYANFFEVHKDPGSFSEVLRKMQPTYSAFHNEWGEGRMLLVPYTDKNGRVYIIGASIHMHEYKRIILHSLATTLIIGIILSSIIFLFIIPRVRKFSEEVNSISTMAKKIANNDFNIIFFTSNIEEIQSLIEALFDMKERLEKQMRVLEKENSILKMSTENKNTQEILDMICLHGEQLDPSIKTSILLFDPEKQTLSLGSAPSLPEDYNALLMPPGLPIGQDVGSCGTAAYTKKIAIATDIQNDPKWTPYEAFIKKTQKYNLKACWSLPIISSKGILLGTIANYSSQVTVPSTANLKTLEWSAYLAGMIIEKNLIEKSLIREKEQFKTTLLSVGDGVISTDTNGNVLVMNRVSENLTGWTQEEAFGKPLEEIFYIMNEHTLERCENPVYKVLASEDIINELANHTILVSKKGIKIPIEDSAAPIKDENRNITGAVLVFRDFTDKKQRQDEIEYLSFNDQLTGLYNRRYYEQEIARLDDEKYYPLTLIMADVNGLKLTNDAFGHMRGDLLLQKVSGILKRECRENDIAARIGGDEFVMLLPKTDAKNAEVVINRINTAMKKENIDNIIISISMGHAVKQETSEHIEEVFMKAEDDMYRHKLSESTSMRSKTIDLIMNTLFEKSNREMFHSNRVGSICEAIAENMSFTKDEINEVKLAGLMHDIGKIGISETVLNDSNKLNSEEWLEIKRHSEIGYRILGSVNEFSQIANYVLEHHEKWDGTGYPKGLKGDEISLQARIIAVADAYDAMISDRAYRKALSEDEAIAEIKKCSGTQFDPKVVKVLIEKVLNII